MFCCSLAPAHNLTLALDESTQEQLAFERGLSRTLPETEMRVLDSRAALSECDAYVRRFSCFMPYGRAGGTVSIPAGALSNRSIRHSSRQDRQSGASFRVAALEM